MNLEPNKMEGLFHVHSNYSYDSKCSLSELVEFCKRKCFSFIVLTEHAEDFNESKMRSYVQECENLSNGEVIVLPGLEFSFEEYPDLHLLSIGIKKYISAKDILSLIDEIHSQHGLAVIAHPSKNNHYVPAEIVKKIDGLEIWNAAYDSRFLPNHKSLKLYMNLRKENHSLIAFSGLDMHDTTNFRELTSIVHGKYENERELLDLFKKGQFINKGKYFTFQSGEKFGVFFQAIIMSGRLLLNVIDFVYRKFRRR